MLERDASSCGGVRVTPFDESGGLLTSRIHQPDQDAFRSVLPEEIEWKPFPAFPPSARLAIVVGEPSEPGPYVIRVMLPAGVKLMPHQHPEDRVYTVISGVFYIGLGSRFDEELLQAFPPGAVVVLPGGTPHFHWAKSGAYVTQVTAIGPLGLDYLDPIDDPGTSEGCATTLGRCGRPGGAAAFLDDNLVARSSPGARRDELPSAAKVACPRRPRRR